MNLKSKNISLKAIVVIAVGIWAIVLQNAGIIPTKQNVYVKGGYIDADISGTVDVDDVRGIVNVNVDNTVDVNIHEINGHNRVTTGKGTHSVFPYGYMLPVDNW